MKKLIIAVLIILFPFMLLAQGYQGPASGSVSGGIKKSTEDFEHSEDDSKISESLSRNKPEVMVNPGISYSDPRSGINTEIENHPFMENRETDNAFESELDFDGPSVFNCWVPDCNVIAGPVDLLLAINTTFSITDKQGNVIKEINTNIWFAGFIGAGLVFDPKCFYDKTEGRFIMTYLYYDSQSGVSLMLLCISDDSTAMGSWNIWALPANVNGSQPDPAFADFPTMTVTDEGIYLLNDMYPYGQGNPEYAKLRVINKQEALSADPGKLSWKDLWDFRNPLSPGAATRTLKLVHNLDESGSVYLTGLPNPSGATFSYLFLYRVNDDYDNLNVTSNSVPCAAYSMPPHMAQPGGGKPMQLWWFFYSEQVQRNGKIFAAHSVNSQTYNTAAIHYMEIDTSSQTLSSEIFIAGPDRYYGYPDMMVDLSGNVFMVYNRSGPDEYPGVYYTAKPAGTNIFLNDMLLKTGEGDMNFYCGNTTNPYIRFEDYTDIMFDPSDSTKLWIMGEYTGADNKWKTRIGKIPAVISTGISGVNFSEPDAFSLEQNYPNPFNPVTKIRFNIKYTGSARLNVFNVLGVEAAVLVNDELKPGSYEYTFDATAFPAGVYFYKLQAGGFSLIKKMIIIK